MDRHVSGVAHATRSSPTRSTCSAAPVVGRVNRRRWVPRTSADAAPGTVFEGRWFVDGRVVHVARTPVWLGAPTLTRPPALQGRPVVGGVVTLVPGRWTGGWGAPWGVRTYDQIYVCRNPRRLRLLQSSIRTSRRCSKPAGRAGTHSRRAPFYSGHTNAIPVLGGPPVYPYAQARIWLSKLRVASEPLGPIAPSAPPAASIRERAIRRDGWLRVGRVTCAAHCRVTVTVSSRGRRVFRETWTTIGTEALRAAAAARAAAGRRSASTGSCSRPVRAAGADQMAPPNGGMLR